MGVGSKGISTAERGEVGSERREEEAKRKRRKRSEELPPGGGGKKRRDHDIPELYSC